MGEAYKNFDEAPIVTKVVHIKHWSLAVRELIMAMVIGVLLLLLILFAGLYGKAQTDIGGAPSAAAIVSAEYCESVGCLESAARAVELINKSVDPCDNFYQFACGNYKTVRPVPPNIGSRTVLSDLTEQNKERLVKVIEKPVDRMSDWSAERKLKQFYQACNDMYTREKMRGKPFLDQIVSAVGGWDVLATWDKDSWNLQDVLTQVQVDFWTDALYMPRAGVDWYDSKSTAIQIWPAGTSRFMFWSWYFSPHTEQYRQDYKKFIRRVGSLLQRDAGHLNMTSEDKSARLEQFVNDTFTIEGNIARIAHDTRYSYNPFLSVNKVSLSDLNTETNGVIDWVAQLSHMFPTSGVVSSTRVVLLRRQYFQNMTAMITSLPDQDRNRMMHNYFIWRLAEEYIPELSWEYIHANREIYVDVFGRANFMGVQKYCFTQAKTLMDDALSSMFVSDHFNDQNKQAVHDIADNIKSSLQQQLQDTPWMDEQTKQYAMEKLNQTTFKMGYPDWMLNHDVVDRLYVSLTINVSDSFANLLSLNQFTRHRYDKILRDGEDRTVWIYQTWDTDVSVYWYWNEVIATSGILQAPIYSPDRPHSITFGSLGSLLGQFIHHVVDEFGQYYDKTGDRMQVQSTWWSNSSVTSYQGVRDCVQDVYTNVSKTYRLMDGTEWPIYVNTYSYTTRAIAFTNGIRLALKGYKKWVADRGLTEKPLPGLHMSSSQMFFIGHAQSLCFNRDDRSAFYRALSGTPEEDVQLNMALGQLDEFSQAFGCKAGDNMNHKDKKCEYY